MLLSPVSCSSATIETPASNSPTVSQRGVVFLRNQDVTPQQMQAFMERLTTLSGCVSSQINPLHTP